MQAVFRFLSRIRLKQTPPRRHPTRLTTMSSSTTAASLYAATISQATITGATPEDAKDRKHHLKNGHGFTNPWVGPTALPQMAETPVADLGSPAGAISMVLQLLPACSGRPSAIQSE